MEQIINDVTFKLGGEAGSGVATIGLSFANCMRMLGLEVFTENDFPSLIRGGHNTFTARASAEKITALHGPVDVLVALSETAIKKGMAEMSSEGAILYDGEKIKTSPEDFTRKDIKIYSVPFARLAIEKGGSILYYNTVALGAVLGLLDADISLLENVLRKAFGRKGEEIVQKNLLVGQAGYENVKALNLPFKCKVRKIEGAKPKMLILGNDAVCLAGIKSGCKFVAEYPMSPSSSILHFMAAYERSYNIVVKHTEDEIAAVNMIIGGAFTGARTMTGTSGGGFSLMAEGIGMAGIAEVPIVIVEVQRCGPSTGLPTYTEQADLQFVLHVSQGEFPRIVIAPGDPEECFYMTQQVFNYSDICQVPSVILLDKYLGELNMTHDVFDQNRIPVDRGKIVSDEHMEAISNFKRHEITADGISLRCFPGQKNGIHVASSYEHDETGFTSEEPDMRVAQISKRYRKLDAIPQDVIVPKIYGNKDSGVLLVSWGSTKGVILEAMKYLKRDEDLDVKYMHIPWISPFPSREVLKHLKAAGKAIIFEGNSTAQMRSLIRENTGFFIKDAYLRFDGRPFQTKEIIDEVKRLVRV